VQGCSIPEPNAWKKHEAKQQVINNTNTSMCRNVGAQKTNLEKKSKNKQITSYAISKETNYKMYEH
jgi:biotin synthase-like enzyme